MKDAQTHRRAEAQMDRREALGAMATGAYGVTAFPLERFRAWLTDPQQARFFSADEAALVRVLADMIIPRDDKSGGATDAGVPDYMDFIMTINSPQTQTQWRDGLKWYDDESNRRFQKKFVDAGDAQRGQILDDIAWPARARPEFATAAQFFSRVRDLVGAGFFSSRMGIEDIGYQGNVFNPNWQGAPVQALTPLGLSYTEWDAKYGKTGGSGDRGTGNPAHRAPRTARP